MPFEFVYNVMYGVYRPIAYAIMFVFAIVFMVVAVQVFLLKWFLHNLIPKDIRKSFYVFIKRQLCKW